MTARSSSLAAGGLSAATAELRIRPDVFSYEHDIELTIRRGKPRPTVRRLLERLLAAHCGADDR